VPDRLVAIRSPHLIGRFCALADQPLDLYRYMRNPMYVAVVAIILGQALLFGDWRLIVYGGLFWVATHVSSENLAPSTRRFVPTCRGGSRG
jgi:hypothetical protein